MAVRDCVVFYSFLEGISPLHDKVVEDGGGGERPKNRLNDVAWKI